MISFETNDPVIILEKIQEYQAENPAEQCITFNLTGPPISDLKRFILSGFLPFDSTPFIRFIEDWLVEGLSMVEITAWHRFNAVELIREYSETKTWQYCTIGEWIKRGTRETFSLPLILYGHDLVYSSMRPKTDMMMFQGPGYLTARREDIRYTSPGMGFWTDANGETWNVAAVTRYALGMFKSLYYDKPGEFCGTFYYFEPESKTYLAYKTSLSAKNKTLAFKILLLLSRDFPMTDAEIEKFELGQKLIDSDEQLNPQVHYAYYKVLTRLRNDYDSIEREIAKYDIRPHDIYDRNLSDPEFGEIYRGTLPIDLMMTFEELRQSSYPKFSKRKRYVGEKIGLYGIEDYLDQVICLAGKELEIDVFHLTHMVGSHQVVHEILDTRPRVESFKSLVYLTD